MAGFETVIVHFVWLKPVRFHMNGMGKTRFSHFSAFSYDFAEMLILCDLPFDRHCLLRHSPAIQRIWCQTCPKHDTVRKRIT
ncbi:Hypothetical protein A7A1_1937 [Bacillus subtilis subsp. subtilis str. BSP1]|nr:Hypothetical protein A7A1_1937 [Bacillus subtilis subsp. subtilis str. BSP1]